MAKFKVVPVKLYPREAKRAHGKRRLVVHIDRRALVGTDWELGDKPFHFTSLLRDNMLVLHPDGLAKRRANPQKGNVVRYFTTVFAERIPHAITANALIFHDGEMRIRLPFGINVEVGKASLPKRLHVEVPPGAFARAVRESYKPRKYAR